MLRNSVNRKSWLNPFRNISVYTWAWGDYVLAKSKRLQRGELSLPGDIILLGHRWRCSHSLTGVCTLHWRGPGHGGRHTPPCTLHPHSPPQGSQSRSLGRQVHRVSRLTLIRSPMLKLLMREIVMVTFNTSNTCSWEPEWH